MEKPESHRDYDKQLMFQAAGGDAESFTHLHKKFHPIVRSFLAGSNTNHSSLNDLTQEVFVRAWRGRREFRGKSTVKTYLLGIAKKVAWEQKRRDVRKLTAQTPKPSDMSNLSLRSLSEPQANLYYQQRKQAVHQAISQLPAQQRQAIRLFYLMELPSSQAARQAGCSRQTLWNRLQRGRENLRKLLGHSSAEQGNRSSKTKDCP